MNRVGRISLLVVLISALCGNPVAWFLFEYTELTKLAQVVGGVSAIVFLTGVITLLCNAFYCTVQRKQYERETDRIIHDTLEKTKT